MTHNAPERADDAELRALDDRRQTRRGGRRWYEDKDLSGEHERLVLQLGQEVHLRRERLGWSLERLAAVAGLDEHTVHDLERGRTDPRLSTYIRILYALGKIMVVGCVSPELTPVNPASSSKT